MLACAKTLNFTGDVVKFRCNHVRYSKGMKSSHRQSTPWWQDKRIVQGDNIHNFIKIHEWDIVNIIYLWKIQVALKSTLIWKCAKTVVWNQSWFQGWLEIKVKIHELTWNSRLFSKWARIPFPLSAYAILLSLKNLLVLINTKFCNNANCTHNHVVTFTNTLRHLIKIYDRLNFRQASHSSRLVNLGNSLP